MRCNGFMSSAQLRIFIVGELKKINGEVDARAAKKK